MIKLIKNSKDNSTKPLSYDQFCYIIDELFDAGDFRLAVYCHLVFRCVRPSICLHNITIEHLYDTKGNINEYLRFKESDKKDLRTIPIAGSRFINALRLHYSELKQYKRTDNLFYSRKRRTILWDSSIRFMLRQFIGKRGIEQCSPYSIRKGGARFMFDSGVRIEYIQKVMGHSHPDVTRRYINIVDEDIITAMDCVAI